MIRNSVGTLYELQDITGHTCQHDSSYDSVRSGHDGGKQPRSWKVATFCLYVKSVNSCYDLQNIVISNIVFYHRRACKIYRQSFDEMKKDDRYSEIINNY